MSIEQTDAESAAVAKNPDGRVKLSDIEANIAFEFTRTGDDLIRSVPTGIDPAKIKASEYALNKENAALLDKASCFTIHMIIMRTGFIVIGKSAPMDPSNFNAELGAKFAREDAIRQLWPLMAFARLAGA